MRNLLLAAWALGLSGCIIAVKDDGSAPPETSPPPAPAPAVREPESDIYMVKYVKDVPEVFEGIKKACARSNFRITTADTPGGDNWTVRGHHASGIFDLHIYLNRKDHKTRTTVTVSTGRGTQFQCREWTRRLQAEIGKQIGEDSP